MESAASWYLMKAEDGSIFGPISLEQLYHWAHDAQISPLDKVSTDGTNWRKAPMLPDLQMDYLIHVGESQYYGPTTVGAVREFIEAGEITLDTLITNCTDGTECPVRNLTEFAAKEETHPVRTSIRLSLQQRIRELEVALLEERRAREAAEARCDKLSLQLAELGLL
jgi:hypothetical protein